MHVLRRAAVTTAASARRWGVVLGTLGRQGSPAVLDHLQRMLARRGLPFTTVLLSEVFPAKLAAFPDIEAWVQVCCPRLSIDWGHAFPVPLLSPYEAEVALGAAEWMAVYPMDYYSKEGGSWANYAEPAKRAASRDRCAPLGRAGGGCAGCEAGECEDDGYVRCGRGDAERVAWSGVASAGRASPPPSNLPAPPPPPHSIPEAQPASIPPPSPPPSPPAQPAPTARPAEGWSLVSGGGRSRQSKTLARNLHATAGTVMAGGGGGGAPLGSPVLLVNDGVRFGRGVLERCGALERRCFAKHEAMDLAAETRGRGAALIVALAEDQAWPDMGALAASDGLGGREPPPVVAGYLVLQRLSVRASVAKLVVAPARRRQGIGRLLLSRAVELATAGRAQVCTLHVDASNAPALALYRSLGFAVVGAKPDYYCVGRDAYAMELVLVAA